jgi:nicotinate-nucleotide adenylyltransferase
LNIAIFGGTFDPIHNAHLTVAREAAERFALDRVLFVTAGYPPHKPENAATSYEHRHRMVELACAGTPGFEPSRLEAGEGKSYSIQTIKKVRAGIAEGDRLFFVIGADAFAEIQSWHRAAEVLRAVEFIVVARPGYRYPCPEGARVHRLETLALPVSSSEIRRRLEAGQAVSDLPAAVLAYVAAHGLYR